MTRNDDADRTDAQRDRPTDDGSEAPSSAGERPLAGLTSGRSRRDFLKASAGAGALAFGLPGPASAARAQEVCGDENGSLTINDDFRLLMNQWGHPGAEQCIWINDDGSYGYDFDAAGTDSGSINYPESFIGTRPWGSDTGVPEFPLRRGDVDELTMEVEADYDISPGSNGEWDWAEEWWLLEQPPGQETGTHQYEVMLLLDWGPNHSHGSLVEESVWTDRFGNTVDLWAHYSSGGTSAEFFIFRIQGGHDGGRIDLKEAVDYLTANYGVSEDLLVSGIELGNEYWGGGTNGQITYETFDVTVNGSTYTSGASGGGGGGDATAPTVPSDLAVTGTTSSSVTLSWSAASDSGGSGLDHYVVSVDGSQDQTVAAGTTSATVSGLSADASYEFGVSAVDGAGNESSEATASASTDADDGSGGGGGDALVVNDYDGDPAWSSNENDLGEWCGAGSFENGGGSVSGGALQLAYDGGGWFQEQINRDVSEYSTLVLRMSGANGGEESEITFDMGGVQTTLADVTSDSIGTSAADVAVDLAAAGVDRTSSSLSLRLNFWQGGSSTIDVEEIRFE